MTNNNLNKINCLEDVSWHIPHRGWLYKNFNFSLSLHAFTCLLGASGAGKSLLLKMIAGLHQPHSGKIASDLQHRISYLAQDAALLPWLNLIDNVLIGFKLRGNKISVEQREKATYLLAQVGLNNAIHLKPHELSGGMKQRVALVRTLLEDREIVLMDEPFSALDVLTRMQLQDLAAELLKNKTVLMVTHDPLEALRMANEIYLLKNTPVQLHEITTPPSLPVRDVSDPHVLNAQAQLLKLLGGMQHESA